jgi:tetratricopeptide (TPR) repeat protein
MHDDNEALSDLDKAIELDSNNELAYYDRGSYYYTHNEIRKALEDFNNVIQLNPECYEAYYKRGYILYELDSYELAKSDFVRAIDLHREYKRELDGLLNKINKKLEK